MTRNQLQFQQNRETARANRAMERENQRSNMAREHENVRSNKARERENIRHNTTSEAISAAGTVISGVTGALKGVGSLITL